MNPKARQVQRTYLMLMLFNTLAASLIWGINTIFLLDAGLSNFEAFAANAFFTAGMLLFEIPTGVVADLKGRRLSYLLGTVTLAVSTALYLIMWQIGAPFWGWAISSALLGLGFTFFSGAVEAWLVDALQGSGFKGKLESVFAKGQIVQGSAMLTGSIAGGVIAQITNLGVPYILRAIILIITFILAFVLMRDIGFTPVKGVRALKAIKNTVKYSVEYGFKLPSVRWILLTSPFFMGALGFAFYAMQPYLLELYGDKQAYGIAGVAAALVAGAQIAGGLLVPHIGRLFKRRTTLIVTGLAVSTTVLALTGFIVNFWAVIILMAVWACVFAALMPVRQAYLNSLIPSNQRATILSFDSFMGSGGGIVSQPLLGKAADLWGYAPAYLLTSTFQVFALPFALLARRASVRAADTIQDDAAIAETHVPPKAS